MMTVVTPLYMYVCMMLGAVCEPPACGVGRGLLCRRGTPHAAGAGGRRCLVTVSDPNLFYCIGRGAACESGLLPPRGRATFFAWRGCGLLALPAMYMLRAPRVLR